MKYTKDFLNQKLETDQRWLEKGILAIYNRQTQDEKIQEDTKYYNNMGFRSCDARLGSYYAKWILSGKHLSGRHLLRAKKIMKHYSGQLLRVIKEKGK